MLDITEKREGQEALRRSEELFRQVADNIKEVFWLVDPLGMRILCLSPAYEEVWGRSRQEIGDDLSAWLEAIHPEDRDRRRKQILQPRVVDLNEVVAHLEPMLRRLIGEDLQVQIRLEPDLGSVRVDPGQIEQVVINLAVNARDAMSVFDSCERGRLREPLWHNDLLCSRAYM